MEVQALVETINSGGVAIATEAFGVTFGANHQMFWGAFNPPVFPRDALLFFDDEAKYNRVANTKGCLDPDGVFDSEVLSIPLPDYMPESCTYDVPEESRSMKKSMKKSRKESMKQSMKMMKLMKMKKSMKMSMKSMRKGMMGYY